MTVRFATIGLLLLLAVPLGAQIPDTVRTDTIAVPIPPGAEGQSPVAPMPTDSAAPVDSLTPVPPFPLFPRPGGTGWSFDRWDWTRQDLARYHDLSLLVLLERTPGLSVLRAGNFGMPAGITTLAGAGSRVRVYIDGLEVDPLGFTAHDLQQVAVGDLESVHVERHFDGVRIELIPMRLPDARPLSAIEAATGVYDAKMLRAMLIRGIGRRMVGHVAFDQSSHDGVGFNQPFTFSSGRASLSYALGVRTALQAEYRTESAQSGGNSIPIDATRRTLALRARSQPWGPLYLDAMVGRASRDPDDRDPIDVDLESTQGAVRAVLDLGRVWAEGTARARSDPEELGLAAEEFEGRVGLIVLPWLVGEGRVRAASVWGANDNHGSITARMGPLAGLSGFATVAFGDQALLLVRDDTIFAVPGDTLSADRVQPFFSAVTGNAAGVRVGADWRLARGGIGAAGVTVPAGTIVPLGLMDVDRGFDPVSVGEAQGVEGYFTLPVPFTRDYLRVNGWATWWQELGGRPYVPKHDARVALEAHGIFYGGDLEPWLRVEGVSRGSILFPTGVATNSYSMANLALEIRILAVRAFFVFNNLTGVQTAEDLPGLRLPGPHFYYGLRWTFRN